MNNDSWSPLAVAYSEDATTELLSSINRGLGTTLSLKPAAAQGLTTSVSLPEMFAALAA